MSMNKNASKQTTSEYISEYNQELIREYYGEEMLEKIIDLVDRHPTRLNYVVAHDGEIIDYGFVLTSHGMREAEFLELIGLDMDKYCEEHGWDGWDWELLHIIGVG